MLSVDRVFGGACCGVCAFPARRAVCYLDRMIFPLPLSDVVGIHSGEVAALRAGLARSGPGPGPGRGLGRSTPEARI